MRLSLTTQPSRRSRLGGPPPPPPRSLLGEGPQPRPQLGLLVARGRRVEPLGRAVLADDPARSSFGDPEPFAAASPRRGGDGSGSEVSLGQLLEHRLVELGLGQELLQPGVLALELLEPLGVVGLHAAVLGDPAVPGRLGDLAGGGTPRRARRRRRAACCPRRACG